MVNDVLIEYFSEVFNVEFTGKMEAGLDKIESSGAAWKQVALEFYEPIEKALVEAKDAPKVQEATDVKCHLCAEAMFKRWSKYGAYLICKPSDGCTGSSRSLLTAIGVSCPEKACGGDLVERRTKKGRLFYGCSEFPNCEFASWKRPLAEPCPNCDGLIEAVGRARADGSTPARCTQCDWTAEVTDSQASSMIPGPAKEFHEDQENDEPAKDDQMLKAVAKSEHLATGLREKALAALAVADARGCKVVDKRPKGSLWIVGGDELAVELEPLGFKFGKKGGRASKHEPAWYLTGDGEVDA